MNGQIHECEEKSAREKKTLLINSEAIVRIGVRVSEPICDTKSISYINIHRCTAGEEKKTKRDY
jgi:hypothetical protein